MAKNRVKVHGWAKTRNRALLGHPRRCVVRWGGAGCWSVGWGVGVWGWLLECGMHSPQDGRNASRSS